MRTSRILLMASKVSKQHHNLQFLMFALGNEFQIDGVDDEDEFIYADTGHSEEDDKFDQVVGTL